MEGESDAARDCTDAYKNNTLWIFLFYDERQPCRTVTQRSVEVKPGKCSGPQKEMFETRPLVFFKSAHFYNPPQTSLKSTILFPDLCDNESYLQFKLLKKKYSYYREETLGFGTFLRPNSWISADVTFYEGDVRDIINTTWWLSLISVYRYTQSLHKLASLLRVTSCFKCKTLKSLCSERGVVWR